MGIKKKYLILPGERSLIFFLEELVTIHPKGFYTHNFKKMSKLEKVYNTYIVRHHNCQ